MRVKAKKVEHKTCSMCTESKNVETSFYRSYSVMDSIDGRVRVCKHCLKTKFDNTNIEEVKNMLRMVDKPLNLMLWNSANTKPDVIGEYFKLINAKDYRNQTWEDSTHENKEEIAKVEKLEMDKINPDNLDLEELKEKYGYGYPDEEYFLFEKKFNVLKSSFQLPTPMHEEYLREYCVNKVKETLAKAQNDFKQAKEWANMAKDVADAGKLKPSQMTKADLAQGMDNFGQIAKLIDETYEVLEILPKFRERPKDNVDVTLWLYINYIRDLKGLPEVEYSEIYKFYDDRVKDYSESAIDFTDKEEE